LGFFFDILLAIRNVYFRIRFDWLPAIYDAFEQQGILIVIVVATTLLFIIVILFALYSIYLRLRNNRKRRRWQQLERSWRSQLNDILAGEKEPESIHRLVKKKHRLYFVDYLYKHALRLKGQELAIISEMADPYLPVLLHVHKKSEIERRARVVTTVSHLDIDKYLEFVVEALDDESPIVAMAAARIITQRKYVQYARKIIDRLHVFEGWSLNILASMLANMGMEIAPELRSAMLDTNRIPRVRTIVTRALTYLKDPHAANTAAFVLQETEDTNLQINCLKLIADVGVPEHADTIRYKLNSENDTVVTKAIAALGTVGDESDIERITPYLNDPSPWKRLETIRTLKVFGQTELLQRVAAEDTPTGEIAEYVLEHEK